MLKFLESYASRQTKLWKVLSKYHKLPDHFHDLKAALQTEFDLLKTAAIHTKLAHLDKQIQIHCIYPHQHSDAVQINASDYDPDVDGDTNPINAIQPLNTDTAKEETVTSTTESEDHNTIGNSAHRSQHQSTTTRSVSQNIKPNNVQQ